MHWRSGRSGLVRVCLLALVVQLALPQASWARSLRTVEADNSLGAGAAEGVVLDFTDSHATLAVIHRHDFWTNVILQPTAQMGQLTPAGPLTGVNVSGDVGLKDVGDVYGSLLGGLYARLGAIPPYDRAVWDWGYDTSQPVSRMMLVTPQAVQGNLRAYELNVVTIVTTVLGVTPTADSVETVLDALHKLEAAQDFLAAAQALADLDPAGFIGHLRQLLSDNQQIAALQAGLAEMGVRVTTGALRQLLRLEALWQLLHMTGDMIRALVAQSRDGQIIFHTVLGPVETQPATQSSIRPVPIGSSSAPDASRPSTAASGTPQPVPYVPPASASQRAAGAIAAERVYGQSDFTSKTTNVNSLVSPSAVAVDPDGNLYVTDARGVGFFASGSIAHLARIPFSGRPNAASVSFGVPLRRLSHGVALDASGNLYVADTGNHRVLLYPKGSTTATRVYGQPDFTSNRENNGGVSALSLLWPYSVAVDGVCNIYVADSGNNRVLLYPRASTTATRVYGQPDFGSGLGDNGGLSDTSLTDPGGVALDAGGNLYVADTGNNRVLYYPNGSATATRVYGQPNFTSYSANNGGLSATSLSFPRGVAIDGGGNLYVGDQGNNRVLFYQMESTTATRVYGQPDFTSNRENNGGRLSATSLAFPDGVAVDTGGKLYVADRGNDRALLNLPFATASNSPSGAQVTGMARAEPQPQATLTAQQQGVVEKLTTKLPYEGSYFSLSFSSQTKHFSLILDEQYQHNGDQESDLFLRANGIDDRSWLVPLEVAIRQGVGRLGAK